MLASNTLRGMAGQLVRDPGDRPRVQQVVGVVGAREVRGIPRERPQVDDGEQREDDEREQRARRGERGIRFRQRGGSSPEARGRVKVGRGLYVKLTPGRMGCMV